MSNYKDTMAYRFYKQAEENLESGKAVEELYEKILKEIIERVRYGEKGVHINKSGFPSEVIRKVSEVLTEQGFTAYEKVYKSPDMFVGWDFSDLDSKGDGK